MVAVNARCKHTILRNQEIDLPTFGVNSSIYRWLYIAIYIAAVVIRGFPITLDAFFTSNSNKSQMHLVPSQAVIDSSITNVTCWLNYSTCNDFSRPQKPLQGEKPNPVWSVSLLVLYPYWVGVLWTNSLQYTENSLIFLASHASRTNPVVVVIADHWQLGIRLPRVTIFRSVVLIQYMQSCHWLVDHQKFLRFHCDHDYPIKTHCGRELDFVTSWKICRHLLVIGTSCRYVGTSGT